jgi:choline/glycine/proline betaine transport protein
MFIARISRGRTIRQFLLGVLFAPAGFSFIWFTIFGDVAIWLDLKQADGAISRTVADNMPIALFIVFDYLPWSVLLSWIAGLLVAVYFITASDAGALVIAMITARGEEEPVLWLRVFWALTCGGVAACLLLAGGLAAVQMAAVIAALPLAVVMLLMCYGIWKALNDEVSLRVSGQLPSAPLIQAEGAAFWRRRLGAIVSHPSKRQVLSYIGTTVIKALETVVAELDKRNLEAAVERLEDGLQLVVRHGDGAPDFVYAVRAVGYPVPAFALTDAARREGEQHRYFRAEVFLKQGGRGYDIYGYETNQVIADVINHYDQFRHYLHAKGTG